MPKQASRRPQRPNPEALRQAARSALLALDEPEWGGLAPGFHDRMPEEQAVLMLDKVVEVCQGVESHPALRLIGTCGHLAGYCAVVIDEFYGVAVAAFPYLQPATLRTGGIGDLALFPPGGGSVPWIYAYPGAYANCDETFFGDPNDTPIFGRDLPYFQLGPAATVHAPIAEDDSSAATLGFGFAGEVYRSTLLCRRCEATEPVKTSTLLRKMLEAIANGETEVRLGAAPAAQPSQARRPEARGKTRPRR